MGWLDQPTLSYMSNLPLEEKKVAELRAIAEQQDIDGFEDMNRDELIEVLGGESKEEKPANDTEEDEEEEENPLDSMDIKELRATAKAREVDIAGLRTKVDIIKALTKADNADDEEEEEEEPPVPTTEPPAPKPQHQQADDPTPGEIPEEDNIIKTGITGARVSAGSKAARMKAKLAAQPKMSIMIPLEGGEKFGITHSVILNGYRMNIIKGIYVSVPHQVGEVIVAAQQATLTALEGPMRDDGLGRRRIDEETPQALQ